MTTDPRKVASSARHEPINKKNHPYIPSTTSPVESRIEKLQGLLQIFVKEGIGQRLAQYMLCYRGSFKWLTKTDKLKEVTKLDDVVICGQFPVTSGYLRLIEGDFCMFIRNQCLVTFGSFKVNIGLFTATSGSSRVTFGLCLVHFCYISGKFRVTCSSYIS